MHTHTQGRKSGEPGFAVFIYLSHLRKILPVCGEFEPQKPVCFLFHTLKWSTPVAFALSDGQIPPSAVAETLLKGHFPRCGFSLWWLLHSLKWSIPSVVSLSLKGSTPSMWFLLYILSLINIYILSKGQFPRWFLFLSKGQLPRCGFSYIYIHSKGQFPRSFPFLLP